MIGSGKFDINNPRMSLLFLSDALVSVNRTDRIEEGVWDKVGSPMNLRCRDRRGL